MKLKNQIELPLLEFFLIAMDAAKEPVLLSLWHLRLEAAPKAEHFIQLTPLWH